MQSRKKNEQLSYNPELYRQRVPREGCEDQERRFFNEGLALAPDPALVPFTFTPECRFALGGPLIMDGGVSSGRVGGVGPRGTRRA